MKKEFKVNIPSIPNFIIVNTYPIPLSSFTEKELEQIGKEWTQELIKKSKTKHND